MPVRKPHCSRACRRPCSSQGSHGTGVRGSRRRFSHTRCRRQRRSGPGLHEARGLRRRSCGPLGWALFSKGGYGSAFGVPVGSTDEIKSQILRLKAAGAGIIKVITSGMVSLEDPGAIAPGGLERDAIAFAVLEARRLGLGVMAHANGEAAIISSAEAGVRSLEHGFFMTGRALELMAQRKSSGSPPWARSRERRTGREGKRGHLSKV